MLYPFQSIFPTIAIPNSEHLTSFAPFMGGVGYKANVNVARKALVKAVALPRGAGLAAEPVLLQLARDLVAEASREELQQLRATLPASWATEALKARCEPACEGTYTGAQRSVVAPKVPKHLKKHVSSRAAERWGQANRNELEKEVEKRRR